MKLSTFYFLVLLLSFKSFSQENEVNRLLKQSDAYSCRNIKVSDSLANKALTLTKKEKYVAWTYKILGKNLLCTGKYEASFIALKKSCSISKSIKDYTALGKSLANLSTAYRLNGSMELAKSTARKQLEAGRLAKNDTIIATSYSNLSNIFSTLKLIDSNAVYAEKALKIAEKANIKSEIWKIKVSLGAAFFNSKNYTKALEYYFGVIPYLTETNDTRNLALMYNNISAAYNNTKDFEKALEYRFKCLDLSTKNKYIDLEITSLSNLGNLYSDKDEYVKSNNYFLKSLEKLKTFDYPLLKANSLSNLANNYYKLGQYSKALQYGKKALKYTQEKELKSLEKFTNEKLYAIYKKTGNSKKALEHFESFKKIENEMLAQEKANAIVEIETKYEVEKKELLTQKAIADKEIAEEKSKTNKTLFIVALGAIGLLLISAFFYFSKAKAQKEKEITLLELKETQKRLAIEKQYRDSELKALKSQMNPHFIFNALNSIQEFILMSQKTKASDYLSKFADLIRNYLHFSNSGYISINEEINNLDLYLDLEKMRFEDDLEYTFQIEDSLKNNDDLIPTMLIQPYVENAIKHGLLHKKGNRNLQIKLTKTSAKTLQCEVTDNGIGREKSRVINSQKTKNHKSFATNATAERLKLLNASLHQKIGVETTDLKDETGNALGTQVILNIPIKTQE